MMISWYITADDDNGHQEISVRTSELGIGVTLSIRFRSSTWVENSQDDQDACSHFQVEANSIFHFPFLIFFVFLYFSNLEDAENIPQIGIVPRVLIELWWSLPKELEVQRDTNVARLQTTTIYNFFNKHLDRWRIKEYTSSQSMYNVMSLNFWDLQMFPVSPPKNTHIKWPSNLPKTPLRPPESAVDGDLETYWATETGYPSAEFHLDLGSSQLIMVWESQVESDWWVKMVDVTCPEMNRNWMSWDFLGFCSIYWMNVFFFWFLGCLKC